MSGNAVTRVTVYIQTVSGEEHTLIARRPAPGGNDPAFMSQQLQSALAQLGERGHRVIEAAYGTQVRLQVAAENGDS